MPWPGGVRSVASNEGFSSNPIDITGQLPYAGSVHYGSSYYEVTALEPGQSYTVTLGNPTQDVALAVDGCSSNDGGTLNEACTISAPNDGTLSIRVSYLSPPAGATYTIDVAVAGPRQRRRSPLAQSLPLPLPLALSLSRSRSPLAQALPPSLAQALPLSLAQAPGLKRRFL